MDNAAITTIQETDMNKALVAGLITVVGAVVGCMSAGIETGIETKPEIPAEDGSIGPGQPSEDCSQISTSQCEESKLCMIVEGGHVNMTEQCIDSRQAVACMDVAKCPADVRFAWSPSGELWEFLHGCTPTGWVVEGNSKEMPLCAAKDPPGDEPGDPCSGLFETECRLTDGCSVLEGYPVNEAAWCMESVSFVECWRDMVCFGLPVFARDPSGELWLFSAGCYPLDWDREDTWNDRRMDLVDCDVLGG